MEPRLDVGYQLIHDPSNLWMVALIGAVCVIGITNFLKNWITNKKIIKWAVLLVSLFIGIVMSPLVEAIYTTIIIMWFLILAIATLARDAIVAGLPGMISGIMERGGKKDV